MSFRDFDRKPSSSSSSSSEFARQAHATTQLIFKISSSIALMQQIVNTFGTEKDTPATRSQLQETIHCGRELVREANQALHTLNSLIGEGNSLEHRQRNMEYQKLSRDFKQVLDRFQSIQHTSADRSREVVAQVKSISRNTSPLTEHAPLLPETNNQQQLLMLTNEIDYNENLIEEREQDIKDIEQGIHEINDIFRDLGTIVHEQQGLLDNIESNVMSVAVNMENAREELSSADRYQKRTSKTLCWIMLFFFAASVILILVLVL